LLFFPTVQDIFPRLERFRTPSARGGVFLRVCGSEGRVLLNALVRRVRPMLFLDRIVRSKVEFNLGDAFFARRVLPERAFANRFRVVVLLHGTLKVATYQAFDFRSRMQPTRAALYPEMSSSDMFFFWPTQ